MFEDQLGNAVSCTNLEVRVSMVEKENLDEAGIVFVNNPHANIDHMFSCEGGLGSDAAVCTRGDCKKNTYVDESLVMGQDNLIFECRKVMISDLRG